MKNFIAIVVASTLLMLCSCAANITGKELLPLDSCMKHFAGFESGQKKFEAVGGQSVTDLYIALSEMIVSETQNGEAIYEIEIEMITDTFRIAIGENCIQYDGVWYTPNSDAVLRFIRSCLTE